MYKEGNTNYKYKIFQTYEPPLQELRKCNSRESMLWGEEWMEVEEGIEQIDGDGKNKIN